MCLAIPAKIIEVLPGTEQAAVVEVAGVRRKIGVGLIEEEQPKSGDWVLIHVGFALSKISEEQAQEQMEMLTLLGESHAALEEVRGYGLGEAEAAGVSLKSKDAPDRNR
jgi:hydrogenase expression/formation protein HypC